MSALDMPEEGPPQEVSEEQPIELVMEAPSGEHRIPAFANFMNISHSPHGFVLTFGYAETTTSESPIEDQAKIRIVSRVAISSSLLLASMQAMAENYQKFAARFPQLAPAGVEFKSGVIDVDSTDSPSDASENGDA